MPLPVECPPVHTARSSTWLTPLPTALGHPRPLLPIGATWQAERKARRAERRAKGDADGTTVKKRSAKKVVKKKYFTEEEKCVQSASNARAVPVLK